MKPSTQRCIRYCDLFPCERKECGRKLVLYHDKPSSMVEPSEYQRWRRPELTRAFKEGRVVKENF